MAPLGLGREVSWQFVGQSQTRSERQLSEEPTSESYDEDRSGFGEDEDYEKQGPPLLDSPEDHEDILHPLREAANRVGREVERFAEVLDGYNPLRATAQNEKHEMTLELIEHYYDIALDTRDRLREQHGIDGGKKGRGRSRKGTRALTATHDEDEMDVEDSDELDERETPFSESQTTRADRDRWEEETQTWDLLRRLVRLRFPSPGLTRTRPNSKSNQRSIHQYSTERDVWENFLETDDLALERKTVLQWLKDTADESGPDIDVLVQELQQKADRGEIIAHGWLHTNELIKKQKRFHVWPQPLDPSSPEVQRILLKSSNAEPLVTQLDPDAPTRQNRRLEEQDEHFERSTWMGCYQMLRRGKTAAEIRERCSERMEVWRAVSMLGFPEEYAEGDDQGGKPASSALWRRICFSLARKGGGDEYERAVYGILSGDISSVESVCSSWDDFLFAHYNALLRTQFDAYLQKVYPQRALFGDSSNFGAFDAVQFHGHPKSAGKRLVDSLKTDPRTNSETMKPMKMLQGVLIANQFEHFIYQQGLALSKFANAGGVSNLMPPRNEQPENEDVNRYINLDDHDSLRVLTHVLLVYMGLGLDLGGYQHETEVENVIVAYISFLRLAGKEELIPLYSSQLSGARKYAILSRNLIDVTDHEQRVTQIKLMRELGLDVQEFVRMQARYLLNDYEDTVTGYPATGNFKLFEDVETPTGTVRKVRKDFFGDDPDKIERADMLLIRSLEWYLLVDGLWSETFTVGTILYLRFFKHMHLSAARILASRVPSSEIALSKTQAILGESLDFIGLEMVDDEDLTEVLDGTADKKRLMRKHLLAEAKSYRELEVFVEHLDNIETVTSMASLMSEENTSNWQKGWRQQLARAFQPTRNTAQPLQKGWLLTSQREGAEAEFKLLREAYLPETILAYISVLQFGGSALTRDFLLECMDLSALMADEESDLLQLFMKTGRMQELVEAFALASKTLLLITSAKQTPASRSKKMRVKGWTQELWSVKP